MITSAEKCPKLDSFQSNGGSFFLEFLLTFGAMPKVSPAERLKKIFIKKLRLLFWAT